MVTTLKPSIEKPENLIPESLISESAEPAKVSVTWDALPDNFVLAEEPVESTVQPLIAGALSESLELIGYIQPTMLVAANLGICATVRQKLVIKAPDWFYVKAATVVNPKDRRSYSPNLEGEVPQVVMEFLSETDGDEYSVKPTFPLGKWYFYEQILGIPFYIIFAPANGSLEVYHLVNSKYLLQPESENNRYWIAEMGLFLGVWQGEKENRPGYWLRWWDAEGNLLLWGVEQLEQERQRTEQERQRAERLREQLRMLGITPID